MKKKKDFKGKHTEMYVRKVVSLVFRWFDCNQVGVNLFDCFFYAKEEKLEYLIQRAQKKQSF